MSSSSDGGGEKREEELRIHVAQLKEELEREKAEKRQLHQENVREIKTLIITLVISTK